MTAGRFSKVDHDLLADYIGRALDGTPDEVAVARLIDEDPAWARAHAALAPAMMEVQADLAGWGEQCTAMPAAVADRIAAALSGAGPAVPSSVPAQPAGGSQRRPSVPRSGVDRDPTATSARRRRRWSRLAGPIAVAAASVAAVGFGVVQLVTTEKEGGVAGTALSGRADGARATGPAVTTRLSTDTTTSRSGIDYNPQTLDRAAVQAGPASATRPAPGLQPETDPRGIRLPLADALDRLTDQAALTRCLHEITVEHGGGPLTVNLVDYATFQGEPALVVDFVDVTGTHWVWVAGAECGVPGSDADTRYRTRVG